MYYVLFISSHTRMISPLFANVKVTSEKWPNQIFTWSIQGDHLVRLYEIIVKTTVIVTKSVEKMNNSWKGKWKSWNKKWDALLSGGFKPVGPCSDIGSIRLHWNSLFSSTFCPRKNDPKTRLTLHPGYYQYRDLEIGTKIDLKAEKISYAWLL